MIKTTIHIGLPKTGTTYLQDYLLKNLTETTVIRGWYSHRQLMSVSFEKNLIISDEAMSGRLWGPEYLSDFFSNMKKIKKIYGNPKIIFGIRNQITFIPSVYKQYLHEQGFESFDHLFNEGNKGIRKHEDFLLLPKIEYLIDNFSDVFIYSQETMFNKQGRFLSELLSFLEINKEKKISETITRGRSNVGIKTDIQVKTLRKLNLLNSYLIKINGNLSLYSKLFCKLKITPRNICQDYLSKLKSKNFEIPEDCREFIKEYYKNDWNKASKYISY